MKKSHSVGGEIFSDHTILTCMFVLLNLHTNSQIKYNPYNHQYIKVFFAFRSFNIIAYFMHKCFFSKGLSKVTQSKTSAISTSIYIE